MTWKPAPNLKLRVAMVHEVWPAMVVGEIGDPAHKTEESDHNEDERGIEHAADFMTKNDTAYAGAAPIILAWLLSDVTDLQYVIHDRIIYGRNEKNGWKGTPYTGDDPHIDHVHVSTKHGSVGKNAATGTGYDLAAEAYVPPVSLIEFMEEQMPTAAEIVQAFFDHKLPDGQSIDQWFQANDARTNTLVNVEMAKVVKDADTLVTQTAPAPTTP